MTNTELIAKIKAEIESLKSIEYPCDNSQQATGFCDALDRMTDFLSTLESEKLMEGLEEEISRTYHNGSVADTSDMDHVDYENIARHFAEWGYFRAAEKYNEIEYNRQRAEENEKPSVKDAMKELDEKIALVKQRGTWDGVDVDKYMDEVRGREPEKPMVLEEEVKRYYFDNFEYISSDQPTLSILTNIARHFTDWQKEQMMKKAIGGNAYPNDGEIWVDLARYGYKFKEGEPCRIIIVKED